MYEMDTPFFTAKARTFSACSAGSPTVRCTRFTLLCFRGGSLVTRRPRNHETTSREVSLTDTPFGGGLLHLLIGNAELLLY